jgi:SAM-dependent methyltransferase
MLKRLKILLKNEMFEPKLLGLFINPFYIARKSLHRNIESLGEFVTGRTLDLGCGSKPYESLFNSTEYIGIDVKTSIHKDSIKTDIFYDGRTIPFNNQIFDSLVTIQVFEHVFEPEIFLKEISRVLKTNGYLLLTAPFVWDEHEKPFDYARYSSFGLKYLLEKNGFKIIHNIKTEANIKAIFQLLNGYIYKRVADKNLLIKQIVTLTFMAPLTILAIILNTFLPSNEDLYLDNIILAQKVIN